MCENKECDESHERVKYENLCELKSVKERSYVEDIRNIDKVQERYNTFEVIIRKISRKAKAKKDITKTEDTFNTKN